MLFETTHHKSNSCFLLLEKGLEGNHHSAIQPGASHQMKSHLLHKEMLLNLDSPHQEGTRYVQSVL